jgi:hypothetical protein
MRISGSLIHVAEGAGSCAPRIAARAACSAGGRRGTRRRLRRNREYGELRVKLGCVALRAFRTLLAEYEGFEVVMAFLADVFKDGHMSGSRFSRC